LALASVPRLTVRRHGRSSLHVTVRTVQF
jgi:hypothetical protein